MEKRTPERFDLSERFLLVRFSAIGDCVMAVPVAQSIRATDPNIQLTWVVEQRCADVVDRTSLVHERVEVPRDRWKSARWSPSTWQEQLRFFSGLRKRKFDYGLDLQGHGKTALCLRIARPKKRLAVTATDEVSRLLNPVLSMDWSGVHTVERNLQALVALGDFKTTAEFSMPRLPKEREHIRSLVADSGKPLATISIGAGAPIKEYPFRFWMQVAVKLMKQGFDVGFLGGPECRKPNCPEAYDWVGKLSLAESMAAVSLSSIHLAADTGSGHIAAAYGVPVVSVFGPTDPSEFRPYTDKGIVLQSSDRPEDVSVEEVLAATKILLEGNEAKIFG